MKYRYTGQEEKHLPKHGVIVHKKGEIVETDKEINHPEFEKVISKSEEKRIEEQKKEVK